MIDKVMKTASGKMNKTIDAFKSELAKVRTGRAHTNLLDHVLVEYYGGNVPISQAATVNAEDARTLSVAPWDKTMVQKIEKAILNSDLGLNPATSGDVIRVPLPPLTEERRRELVKVVKHEAETARIAIRNIRRDANHELKAMMKGKEISEDEEYGSEDKIQKLTDKHIKEIENILLVKEKELMEI